VFIASSDNDKHVVSVFWFNLGGWSCDAQNKWRRLVHLQASFRGAFEFVLKQF
jgi:hypothetical protein